MIISSFQLLVPLVSAYRYDGPEVNTSLAHSEAKILHEKIDKKAYSDEEIIRILTTRSKAQLLATFNSYKDQFGHAINKVNSDKQALVSNLCDSHYPFHYEPTSLKKCLHILTMLLFSWLISLLPLLWATYMALK